MKIAPTPVIAAKHTNAWFVMTGQYHARIDFAEQIHPEGGQLIHSSVIISRGDIEALIKALQESLELARKHEGNNSKLAN